jgi:hypothetical protein
VLLHIGKSIGCRNFLWFSPVFNQKVLMHIGKSIDCHNFLWCSPVFNKKVRKLQLRNLQSLAVSKMNKKVLL